MQPIDSGKDLSGMTELERCAHICHECADSCLRMVPHCLGRGGEHAAPAHINLLLDCIDICEVSHSLLHRGSSMHTETCRACAVICEACADDCERIGTDDSMMKECAATCRKCAESCRRMGGRM